MSTTTAVAPTPQDVAASTAALHPAAPRTLEDAGLSIDMVTQLVLKLLHFGADYSGVEMARRIGLEFPVIEPVLESLKRTHQVEVFGGGGIGAASYQYRISDAGRRRALLFLEQNHYVGVAPVPLKQYRDYMTAFQKVAPKHVSRAALGRAFSHLVLSDRVLDQVGLAVAGGHSMFVYGPPGNGKTVIAQSIRNLLQGEIAIPHALEVEGQIIRLFDPVNHEPLPEEAPASSLLASRIGDARWVRCRRPSVMVGGELTLDALDLHYSSMGFYTAPVQATANGGVLIIDDFGRQHCSPRDLLNRWIVPLESRVDFLTLQTGQKFDIPFMTMVIFATNIKPSDLVDEAFLRRVQYKVLAENPTPDDFRTIFENCCRERDVAYERSVADHLIERYLEPRGIRLRGCQPRDLIDQALAHAEYREQPRQLTHELLEAACSGYFVDETEGAVA
jgi:predicted ATPase with chaperone activity